MTEREPLAEAEALFWSIRSLPEDEREAALQSRAANVPALATLVRSLLELDRTGPGSFLEPAPDAAPEPSGAAAFRQYPGPVPGRATPLHSGQRLGGYVVGAEIGRGGMGVVHAATDVRLGREVAIKVLPPADRDRSPEVRRIEHEARVLASLNHPNIATLYSLETIDGLTLVTLEIIRGPTLRSLVAEGPLSPVRCAAV
ncbi:MAG: protein kinase, partial [Candidatus Eisenbacteria bacterium]|nr:protein kinase [Candidatus Eisenbacteria bacterium]